VDGKLTKTVDDLSKGGDYANIDSEFVSETELTLVVESSEFAPESSARTSIAPKIEIQLIGQDLRVQSMHES